MAMRRRDERRDRREEGHTPSIRRNYSTSTASGDQFRDLLMHGQNDADAIATSYELLDRDLYEFIRDNLIRSSIPGITANIDVRGRIIIRLNSYTTRGLEYFHFSLFTQNNRYGGLHLTCPDSGIPGGRKIYVQNKEILDCCGKDRKYLITNLIETLLYYFEHGRRRNGGPLPQFVREFIACCLSKSPDAQQEIKTMLREFKYRFEDYIELQDCSADCHRRPHPSGYHPFRRGGSTKLVIYLVKIEKIRELNKKLRKNKTKNKTKIQKNNKKIDELKNKIKKQKEKAKEKLKKEKAKAKEKLKKEKAKVKKVHITKKIKK